MNGYTLNNITSLNVSSMTVSTITVSGNSLAGTWADYPASANVNMNGNNINAVSVESFGRFNAGASPVTVTGASDTQVGTGFAIYTFTSSGGSIVVNSATNVSIQYFALGGGGSGSTNVSGGGGAGGLKTNTNAYALSSQYDNSINVLQPGSTYNITIGAGGQSSSDIGINGGNTIMTKTTSGETTTIITALGGGGGGSYNKSGSNGNHSGFNGGCGGGAAAGYSSVGNGGTGSQGYDGGQTTAALGGFASAGGGGIGGAGFPNTSGGAGNGGPGINYNGTLYGGGGGGANGGLGGSGGGGNVNQDGTNGLGGGGGGGTNQSGGRAGNGGSGVFIIVVNTAGGGSFDVYGTIGIDTNNRFNLVATTGFTMTGIESGQTSYPLNYTTTDGKVTYDPSASDQRLKTNITTTSLGLNFISQLRPVEFVWKDRIGIGLDSNGNPLPSMSKGIRIHQGFIAQEVKEVLDNLSTDSAIYTCINDIPSSIVTTTTDINGNNVVNIQEPPQAKLKGLYTLRHTEFIPPTVKAVQEIYSITQTQESTIQSLNVTIASLSAQLQTVLSTMKLNN